MRRASDPGARTSTWSTWDVKGMKSVCLFWLFACSCSTTVVADDPLIDCVAGTGAAENNGDAGPASAINIGEPFGVEIGPDVALYIAEVRHHRIRRLDLMTR